MRLPHGTVRCARRVWRAGTAGLGRLVGDTRGAAAVEYGFVVTLVVIAILAALTSFGDANMDIWRNVASKVIAAS